MPNLRQFKYFLSHKKNSVQKDSQTWTTLLPMSRKQRLNDAGICVSHGDYFTAVRNFLEQDGSEIITRAVSQHMRREATSQEIEAINIFLEKHGEFYHPARIEAMLHGTVIPFVLNVAISNSGKNCIQREYGLLKQLNEDFLFSFLPKVYGQDCVSIAGNEFKMFLGEWFQGYNEFHISLDPEDEKYKIVVWDHEHGNYFLTDDQAINLYRQAARILTCYYNVKTFEQILSWHHAAGDFVLKCQNNRIDLKLITVRQYRPLFENDSGNENPDAELILEALLVFFLNLAIRIRLDRLDGVGEIVWSDDIAVEGTLKGFFEGLALKPPIVSIPGPLTDCFRNHLLSCSQSDLFGLSQAMVDAYNPQSPEIPVIKKNLKKHVKVLFSAIKQKQEI
ncbi:MAG: hypothetical protein SRB2_04611 [Desulfobacteraceae bacterium Eth-SRB2]|nr:MAG: hypothetical protein SRB2_04611 [Desulfobacteraceae bacterium Eth-SRB2]